MLSLSFDNYVFEEGPKRGNREDYSVQDTHIMPAVTLIVKCNYQKPDYQ